MRIIISVGRIIIMWVVGMGLASCKNSDSKNHSDSGADAEAVVDGGSDADTSEGETDDSGSAADVGEDVAAHQENLVRLVWVPISGGSFQMVSGNDDQVIHNVTLSDYYLLKTEVTVKQYSLCVADNNRCTLPSTASETCNWGMTGREDHPVNCVDWSQAKSFCRWAEGTRLPSEAEWEYAARSEGQDIDYPWGNETASCDYAVMRRVGNTEQEGLGCGMETTMPVCSKPAGNTNEGLCDMAGNVYEWVEDDFQGSYANAPTDGTPWINTQGRLTVRVRRGGGLGSDADHVRATGRVGLRALDVKIDSGFRCASD